MEDKNKYQEALNDIINNCEDFKVKNDSFWLIQNAIEKVEQLKKENEELKKDLQEAIDLIKENNSAFNKTFEDIKNRGINL